MTNEEKQLLLIDLCGRLPYGVIIHTWYNKPLDIECVSVDVYANTVRLDLPKDDDAEVYIDNIKPYLRPMSSMTQEEIDEYDAELDKDMDIVMYGSSDKDRYITSDGKRTFSKNFVQHFGNDWLNAHHFDYRGLILMGLALEAHEGMYKTE